MAVGVLLLADNMDNHTDVASSVIQVRLPITRPIHTCRACSSVQLCVCICVCVRVSGVYRHDTLLVACITMFAHRLALFPWAMTILNDIAISCVIHTSSCPRLVDHLRHNERK